MASTSRWLPAYISRTAILAAALIAVAAAVLVWLTLRGPDHSATKPQAEIVVVGFGGSYGDAWRKAVIEPFERETGVHVRYDETCCARLSSALKAGQYGGDLVVGIDHGGLLSWSNQGYLLVDPRVDALAAKSGIPAYYRHPGALIPVEFAYVIAGHGKDAELPPDWAAFWDTKRFPGVRVFNSQSPAGQMEIALLADGVAPEKLYPIDVPRALRVLERLRASHSLIFARTPADQVNLLATGAARYGVGFSNRVTAAQHDGLPIKFHWNQGLRAGNGEALIKGAHDVDAVIALLEFSMRPAVLADFAKRAGLEPITGSGAVSSKTRIMLDPVYWGENRARIGEVWIGWLVR